MSRASQPDLPIHAVLPELQRALENGTGAVLIAPPGAGKTTAVAPALLSADWCSGTIILLSPRRVAARAAAERMAEMFGEKAGQTVGYLTRLDSKTSKQTRILVMTEAIFVNRIVDDPELPGVSAVLFDEAHERHLDSDLGLALALESQQVLREDLRILVMSATIDGARFSELLGEGTKTIESEGKSYPLRIAWFGSNPAVRMEDHVADAVLTAWREEDGDILAFLPGVGEIGRVMERLKGRLTNVPILPLHGQVDPKAQRIAIRRDAEGRRRIVLATAIAETSLTLDGVRVVVDCGQSRRAEFDRAAASTHLVTRRSSRASAAQRAGRAARQGPGVAYRLWEEGGHAGRPEFDPPEVETTNLAPLLLSLAQWGTQNPRSLAWLDPPPEASIAAGQAQLKEMGALDDEGKMTEWGRKIATLPLDPVFAAAILFGVQIGKGDDVARIALLVQERGLGGQGEDVLARLLRWSSNQSSRSDASRKLAGNWSRRANGLVESTGSMDGDAALAFARAMPGMIAKRRNTAGEDWIAASGRGYRLDPASPLARADWLVVLGAQGQAKSARITSAIELQAGHIEAQLENLVEVRSLLRWNSGEKRVEARHEKRLGAIVFSSGPDPQPDPQAISEMLLAKAAEQLADIVPASLLARGRVVGIDALSLAALAESAPLWLAPLLDGKRSIDVAGAKVAEAILGQLDWNDRQKLDSAAPRHFTTPAGTTYAIDYAADDAPSVEVRAQALFGLDSHPMIGEMPLLLKLTSPAGRPIQSTRDLPGFWRGSWADVTKDMKGRYPKHRWPEQPWTEKPSLKTKNAFSKGQG